MTKIVVEVHDQEKQAFLIELLSSLTYVSILEDGNPSGAANGQHVDAVEDEHTPFYQDPRQPQMEKEVAAFEEQHNALVSQYLGQFIAMYRGAVLDSDGDQRTLIRRVRDTYPEQVILFRKVEIELPGDIVVPSFQFV